MKQSPALTLLYPLFLDMRILLVTPIALSSPTKPAKPHLPPFCAPAHDRLPCRSPSADTHPDFVPAHQRNRSGLKDFLDEISVLLEEVSMYVRRGQEGKHIWVVLCNTEAGDIAQHATDLTPLEITFYRTVVEAIITSYPANSVSTAEALHQTAELESTMKRSDAEHLLSALVSRQWLAKSK